MPHQRRMPTTTDKRLPIDFEISNLINKILRESFPLYLTEKLSNHEYLEGVVRNHVVDDDYICYSILRVCEILRSKNPIFRNTSSINIAQFIITKFPKSDMVQEFNLVDVGFLSFKLNGEWIARRISKNLIDGTAAWAPILPLKRVVLDFPEQDEGSGCARADYLIGLLGRLFMYSGVEVCPKECDTQSLTIVEQEFPEMEYPVRGILKSCIMNRRTGKPLFVRQEKQRRTSPSDTHKDLAALWFGGNVQKANWIIYLTPVQQRDYILKCFNAAKVFVKEDTTSSILYLGYQTSIDENKKLALLRERGWASSSGCPRHAIALGLHFGYSLDSTIECIIRYHYLKKYTYSGCTFEEEEIFRKEGNNFVSLLHTRLLIRRVREKCPFNLESNKALVGEEREFGLHLLRFTDVMREAVFNLTPHSLCEYLYNLSKNFISFIDQTQPSDTLGSLCKAAEVVLEIGFELLGITPESSKVYFWETLPTYELRTRELLSRDHYIALPVLSPKLSSRFEIFSMFVGTDFDNANLFGEIKVTDTYGVHPDKWCGTDAEGYGQLAYFTQYWYDPMEIRSNSLFPLPFGDSASRVSVPFSKTIKIVAHLWVSSKEKDNVYQLCNVDGDKGVIKLYDFWHGKHNMERSTFQVDSVNGCLGLYYYLIKEAVDTEISLSYAGHPRVRGQIRAYYEDDAFDSCADYDKEFYKALIFSTGPTNLTEGSLTLNKSTLAVPKNGVLVLECFFEDVETGKTIKEDKRYHEEREGENSDWTISVENCCFILKVNWIRGRH